MSDTTEIVLLILAVPLFICLLVSGIGALAVYAIGNAKIEIIDELNEMTMRAKASSVVDAGWLTEQGFAFEGCYELRSFMGTTGIVGWKHTDAPIFFCVYLLTGGQTGTDFVTIFSDSNGMTTASRSDGLLIPAKPGSWVQVFPGYSIEHRWQAHIESEVFLRDRCGYVPADIVKPLDREIIQAIQGQVGYVRSLLLWQLRFPIWYMTRVFGLRNKTVAYQFQRRPDYVDKMKRL